MIYRAHSVTERLSGVLSVFCALGSTVTAKTAVDFARDVQPILAQHCYHCHGPDTAKSGLRFDQRDSVLPASDVADAAVRPGDPAHSELFRRLVTNDPDERMPTEGDALSAADIETLRRWIAEGAVWPENAGHWAYATPQRPPLPPVQARAWIGNAIDAFVLARLEEAGLKPAAEADRITLIRRLHLDLTGLPPEPEEVNRFLADTAPGAYARQVERLLASPHYGERWAVRWLDLVRYGDTDGYDGDKVREMWPYRDWVIHAFNQDLPFDRFATLQVAGDLLPGAGPVGQLATAFIRNSGVPQYRFDMLADRVNTVGTVFLGLTLECAQCHNHKFDPVSQREFYELYSLFENSQDSQVELPSPLTGGTAKVLVVGEGEKVKPARLNVEGSPFHSDEPVFPRLPAGFHLVPAESKSSRLDLARWLTDPANPLLARVVVNRQWEVLFGTGLVRTSEDLGLRTEPPSHPELLDWLAVEFVEKGWSLKHLHRLLVLSATYRQSSHADEKTRRLDPYNRLLARGSRFRVEAETVRDIALAASGLLMPDLGGPPVFPPQPFGVSEKRFKGAYKWVESKGAERHRRGLYTFWKRAALYPSFALFDAPRRETTAARRQRSVTPLQALVTLNDPAYVEASVHLGLRMMEGAPLALPERIALGFRRCVSRPPRQEELEALISLYDEERSRFENDPAAGRALLGAALGAHSEHAPAEWAALAMVANVLLNLDETLTRP